MTFKIDPERKLKSYFSPKGFLLSTEPASKEECLLWQLLEIQGYTEPLEWL